MQKVVCRGLFGEEIEVKAEDLMFRPSIYGILVRDDAVLLMPQWDGWDYPGGGVDKGELLSEGLLREFQEETGLTVKQGALLHVSDNFFQPTFTKEQHWHSIKLYYKCEYVSGEISSEGFMAHEHTYMKEAQWVAISDVPKIKFFNQVDNVALIAAAEKAA